MNSYASSLEQLLDRFMELGASYLPKVLLALVTLVFGLWLIRGLGRIGDKALSKGHVDPTVRGFLRSLGTMGLKVLLFISVASMLGIATTSFVAVIGAAGLAVGLALQGSLANFAGGVLILVLKPFKVGDTIEAQGHSGIVDAIQIFHTELLTVGDRRVIIPNGKLYNDVIVNVTQLPWRRVEVNLVVSYEASIPEVRRVLLDAVRALPSVLSEPEPLAEPVAFMESGVQFSVRVCAKPSDVGPLGFQLHERIKAALDAADVPLLIPQRPPYGAALSSKGA